MVRGPSRSLVSRVAGGAPRLPIQRHWQKACAMGVGPREENQVWASVVSAEGKEEFYRDKYGFNEEYWSASMGEGNPLCARNIGSMFWRRPTKSDQDSTFIRYVFTELSSRPVAPAQHRNHVPGFRCVFLSPSNRSTSCLVPTRVDHSYSSHDQTSKVLQSCSGHAAKQNTYPLQ
jgi:hypothetical protein